LPHAANPTIVPSILAFIARIRRRFTIKLLLAAVCSVPSMFGVGCWMFDVFNGLPRLRVLAPLR
jgi:hypothetical protein